MPTTFLITQVASKEAINFDALPVGKVTHYPLETGFYKPYAQFSLCVSPRGFALRMIAFEAITTPQSQVITYLYPFANNPACGLQIVGRPEQQNGVSVWTIEGESKALVPAQARHLNGEDLQGVYWGWDVFLSHEALEQQGVPLTKTGDSFPGNFYKIQTSEPEHYGSFAPAIMTQEEMFSRENMGTFEIVSY